MKPSPRLTAQKRSGSIYETKEYGLFKHLKGNRDIVPANLSRLGRSFKQQQLNIPAIVNEFGEVIDGQHRLEVCRAQKLPFFYIVCKGYGLAEAKILNVTSAGLKWSNEAVIKSEIAMGNKQYILYDQFRNRTYGPKKETYKSLFAENSLMLLLANGLNRNLGTGFRKGHFEVKNYEFAVRMAENILSLKEYLKGVYAQREFVLAMLLLDRQPQFDINHFRRVCEKQYKINERKGSFVGLIETNGDTLSSKSMVQKINEIYNRFNTASKGVYFFENEKAWNNHLIGLQREKERQEKLEAKNLERKLKEEKRKKEQAFKDKQNKTAAAAKKIIAKKK